MNSYVILRGFLYVGIAMLTAVTAWVQSVPVDKIASLTWWDYGTMGVSVALTGMVTLRAFIDGSAERERTKNGNGKSNGGTPSAPPV